MKKKIWLSILAVAVLAGGIFLGVSAINPVSADTAVTPQYGMMQRGRGGDFGPGVGGVSEENLAAALGISVDELETAYQAAFDKALEQAVAADLITQTQADAMKDRGTAKFGLHLGGWLAQGDIDFQALLAGELGITTDELTAAQTKAQETALADAVAAGTITQEQADLMLGRHALRNSETFVNSMTGAYQAAIQAALADGTITQAQADALLNNLETNGFMGGRGGMGGFGGGMRGGGMHGGMGGGW